MKIIALYLILHFKFGETDKEKGGEGEKRARERKTPRERQSEWRVDGQLSEHSTIEDAFV